MDGYLTKPYTSEELFNNLSQWLPVYSPPPTNTEIITSNKKTATPKDSARPDDTVDSTKFEETREIMGENINVMIDAFVDSGCNNIKEMKNHLLNEDYEGLRNSTHALKGSSTMLGMKKLFQACNDTEERCRLGKIENMEHQIEEINILFNESKSAIEMLMNTEG